MKFSIEKRLLTRSNVKFLITLKDIFLGCWRGVSEWENLYHIERLYKSQKAFREVCLNHRNDRQRNPAARAEKCAMGVSLYFNRAISACVLMALFRVKGVAPAGGL